jgi:hypothetical protein
LPGSAPDLVLAFGKRNKQPASAFPLQTSLPASRTLNSSKPLPIVGFRRQLRLHRTSFPDPPIRRDSDAILGASAVVRLGPIQNSSGVDDTRLISDSTDGRVSAKHHRMNPSAEATCGAGGVSRAARSVAVPVDVSEDPAGSELPSSSPVGTDPRSGPMGIRFRGM